MIQALFYAWSVGHYTKDISLNNEAAKSLANGLVGNEFTAWYRLPPTGFFKDPVGR